VVAGYEAGGTFWRGEYVQIGVRGRELTVKELNSAKCTAWVKVVGSLIG
jgi:hypothetical protein